jgi:hypothetical protein
VQEESLMVASLLYVWSTSEKLISGMCVCELSNYMAYHIMLVSIRWYWMGSLLSTDSHNPKSRRGRDRKERFSR